MLGSTYPVALGSTYPDKLVGCSVASGIVDCPVASGSPAGAPGRTMPKGTPATLRGVFVTNPSISLELMTLPAPSSMVAQPGKIAISPRLSSPGATGAYLLKYSSGTQGALPSTPASLKT